MFSIETIEWLSFLVTIVGLPVAIAIFTIEQRKQRLNEEAEIQQLLSDSYTAFLKEIIRNSDLRMLSSIKAPAYTDEQRERALALYSILISIFERAYIMAYAPGKTGQRARYWSSWEDIMREWCQRDDFQSMLPSLLVGEDQAFADYMHSLAKSEASRK